MPTKHQRRTTSNGLGCCIGYFMSRIVKCNDLQHAYERYNKELHGKGSNAIVFDLLKDFCTCTNCTVLNSSILGWINIPISPTINALRTLCTSPTILDSIFFNLFNKTKQKSYGAFPRMGMKSFSTKLEALLNHTRCSQLDVIGQGEAHIVSFRLITWLHACAKDASHATWHL